MASPSKKEKAVARGQTVREDKEPEIALIHVLDLLGSFLGMDPTLVSSSLL